MENFINLLSSYSVVIVVATIMIIAFAKCITRIFRMGATFKADLASKKELLDFEAEIRKDMRGYAIQIQKSVTDAAMTVINNKLKDIDDVKDIATDMKVMKSQLESEIKNATEKYDDMKSIGDSVRSLKNSVTRLEYNKDNTFDRRTEK